MLFETQQCNPRKNVIREEDAFQKWYSFGIFEVKSSHQGEWGFCLWADIEDAPYDFRDHLKVGDGFIRNQSNPTRAYFEKDKASGDGHFVKNCPFWKKKKTNFFLIWTKSGKNNFQLGDIPPPSSLLDNASALLSNKCALLLMQRAISQEQFNSVLHFKKTIS